MNAAKASVGESRSRQLVGDPSHAAIREHSPGRQNEGTLRRAAALAERNRARLTVIEVIDGLPTDEWMLVTVLPVQELRTRVVWERKEQLEQLVSPLRKQGMRVSTAVLLGRPFQEIIREVVRSEHDLLVLTAEGTGGLKEQLFGSTSMHLMRKCPCPVWVMKATQQTPYAQIVAAVDPDTQDGDESLLNEKIVDLATSLARMEEGKLHIVHAWSTFGAELLAEGLSEPEVDEWVRREHDRHESLVHDLLKGRSMQDLDHEVHLIGGKAGDVIPALAERLGADLLVMGTVSRTGIAGFFIGNTAEQVLQQVECSVLTVKPDGFVTPVE